MDEALHSTPKREDYFKIIFPAYPSKSARHLRPYYRLGCRLHRLHILSLKKLLHSAPEECPRNVLCGSHEIRDQFPVNPWMHFCKRHFEVCFFFVYKNDVFTSNRGNYLIADEFISCDLQDIYYVLNSENPCTHKASGSECIVT